MDPLIYQTIQNYIAKADAINAGSSPLTQEQGGELLEDMRATLKSLGAGPLDKRDADTLRILNDVAAELERVLMQE